MQIGTFGMFILGLGTIVFVGGLFCLFYFLCDFFIETLPRIRSDYKNFKEDTNRRFDHIEKRLRKLEPVKEKEED